MLRISLLITCALCLTMSGCKNKHAEPVAKVKELKEAPPERVMAAIRGLKTTLGKRLKGEIAAAGPVAAVDVCKLEGKTLTAAQQQSGLRIGRTSHKLRNPANKAPAWAQAVVAAGAGHMVSEIKRRRVFDLGDGQRGYVEAMGVGALCLTCHGPAEGIAAPLKARIAEHYPGDQATGFHEGDVRGWFWVEYGPRK